MRFYHYRIVKSVYGEWKFRKSHCMSSWRTQLILKDTWNRYSNSFPVTNRWKLHSNFSTWFCYSSYNKGIHWHFEHTSNPVIFIGNAPPPPKKKLYSPHNSNAEGKFFCFPRTPTCKSKNFLWRCYEYIQNNGKYFQHLLLLGQFNF